MMMRSFRTSPLLVLLGLLTFQQQLVSVCDATTTATTNTTGNTAAVTTVFATAEEEKDRQNQTYNQNTNDEVDRVLVVKDALERLASIGVHGLCHPYRDDLSPALPLCSRSENMNPQTQDTPGIRKASPRGAGNEEQLLSDNIPNLLQQQQRRLQENEDENEGEGNDNEEKGDGDEEADAEYESSYQGEEEPEEEYAYYEEPSQWNFDVPALIGTMICIVMGALASGLTVGLLSLDPLVLLIKSRAGGEKAAEQAQLLLPIVKQHHRLLVTLLLVNTMASEALPMFLNDVVPEALAVLISVVVVLIVGEILPAALFTGKEQLEMASKLAGMVRFLMWILYPIANPIARVLDILLHDESESGTLYTRGELSALIRIQYEERLAAQNKCRETLDQNLGNLPEEDQIEAKHHDMRRDLMKHSRMMSSVHLNEVLMAEGALQMKTKAVIDLLVSHQKVFSMSIDTILNERNIVKIFSSGYSRVPVYEGTNKRRIKGVLMTRQLILVNTHDNVPLSRLLLHVPQCVGPDTDLVEMINLFQTGGIAHRVGHMALVCAKPDVGNRALENDEPVPEDAGFMGIITMEDCLEALLQEQIYDEMDAAGRIRAIDSQDQDAEDVDAANNYHLV